MLKAAAIFLVVGVTSELFGLANPGAASTPVTQLLGLVALTVFLILLILGLPSTRNLVS